MIGNIGMPFAILSTNQQFDFNIFLVILEKISQATTNNFSTNIAKTKIKYTQSLQKKTVIQYRYIYTEI